MFGPLYAQEESSSLLTVRVVKILPGKSGEFESLQKELSQATKEAGGSPRYVWQEARGETSTYHVVSMEANFAEFDEGAEPPMSEAAWARWVSRITDTIDTRNVVTYRMHPELEIPSDEGYEAQYLLLLHRVVAPGRHAEYEEWLGKELVPYLKKSGVKGWSVGRLALGGDTNQWTLARYVDSWSHFDETGPLAELSEEDRNAMLALPREVNRGSQNLVLRFRGDLSYSGN